jgi:hypothetical protein
MTIQITKPEIEVLIQQRLDSGVFANVEEILLDALETQNERELWLIEERSAIDEKIGRGLAQLDRGEGIPGDQLRSRLRAAKSAWFAENSSQ